jgi:hypothetical protein
MMAAALPESIESKIERVPESGCWLWTGGVIATGYGRTWHRGASSAVHRVVYELLRGPIPTGLEIHHLCRVRCCVNPAHLEPVTHRENCLRSMDRHANALKTHCPRGHEYSGDNLGRDFRGDRVCRACYRLFPNGPRTNPSKRSVNNV